MIDLIYITYDVPQGWQPVTVGVFGLEKAHEQIQHLRDMDFEVRKVEVTEVAA